MIKKPPYKLGMVFGVFDGLHEGHRHFLDEASKLCETLIVVVALSEVVAMLKKHLPHHDFDERVAHIKQFNPNLKIVQSDLEPNTWTVLKEYAPEIVFLGHDQTALAQALKDIRFPYMVLAAYHPEKFKSSLLHMTGSK